MAWGKKTNFSDPTDRAYNTTWGKITIVHLGSQDAKLKDHRLKIDFKAFVTRFQDAFDGGFKTVQYPNQSTPIAHQSTPYRRIALQFLVPAASEEEALSNLKKCSALANMIMPMKKYIGNKKMGQQYFPKTSFVALKFGNLIENPMGDPLPGWINGFTFNPNFEEGMFIKEMKDAKKEDPFLNAKVGHYLPKVLDVSLVFMPFMTRSGGLGYDESEGKWEDTYFPYDAMWAPYVDEEIEVDDLPSPEDGTKPPVAAGESAEVLGAAPTDIPE